MLSFFKEFFKKEVSNEDTLNLKIQSYNYGYKVGLILLKNNIKLNYSRFKDNDAFCKGVCNGYKNSKSEFTSKTPKYIIEEIYYNKIPFTCPYIDTDAIENLDINGSSGYLK
ncbi:MAG: hypothetical protein HKO92_02240 [Flavobacteriaceae bacterium]|nr:hypothetical protein [Flavobacteriaceae bacterium]